MTTARSDNSAGLAWQSTAARAIRVRGAVTVVLLLAVSVTTGLPLIYLAIASFDVSVFGQPYRFGIDGWREAFGNETTRGAIVTSFILSIRAPIALVIGFIVAYLIVRIDIPGRRFVEIGVWFGFFLPTVPLVMGWLLLLDRGHGLINRLLIDLAIANEPLFDVQSLSGIIWVHMTATTIPFMVILLAPAFRQFDASLEEAAAVSGAGRATVLRRISLPLLAPAMMTALIAAAIKTLETFEVEQILGAPTGINVYATRIYDLLQWDPPRVGESMALSALFLGVLLVMAAIYQLALNRMGRRATIGGSGVRLTPMRRPRWAYAATAVLFAYVGVSVFLPLAALAAGTFTELFGYFFLDDPWTLENWRTVLDDPRLGAAVVSSVSLGLFVGSVGVLAYALIAWPLARLEVGARSLISLMVWLPWAFPGFVLGVTLLSAFLELPFLSWLYGTTVPLIIALAIKELPIGVQMIRTSLGQISAELEEAGFVAGAGFRAVFGRITLPLMAPTLVSVFLLVFVATIRDIGTIVLLATPGTRTLSLLMFDFAGSGRFESAAVLGLIVALMCLAVTAAAYSLGQRVGLAR